MEIAGERAVKLSSNGNNLFATMEFGAVRFWTEMSAVYHLGLTPVGVQVLLKASIHFIAGCLRVVGSRSRYERRQVL